MRVFAIALVGAACWAGPVWAQFKDAADPKGSVLENAVTQRVKVGIEVTATGGCRNLVATTPMPTEWPEQQVRVVEEDFSPSVKRVDYRMIGGSVKQMLIEIPYIAAGQTAKAVVTLEVTRSRMAPPPDTSIYSIPKKLDRSLLVYLGPSPFIESRHGKIVSLAKEVTADKKNDWAKVEAIYDWVRANVEYKNGALKGALRALHDKTGDCEELSSLFIAMCRASKIPARTVWVPDHCYPEFYLVDDEGKGHWFPCQAAGARSFGGIVEHRPILQKGDNFKDPDRPRERQRYVSEHLEVSVSGGGGKPKVKFIRNVAGV